jgi:uncharacterized protein (DUF1697 family)
MAGLRTLLEARGLTDVRTLIQSGNVVFDSKGAPALDSLERTLKDAYGFDIPVVLRTAAAMAKVIERTPFPDRDHSKVHVGFMREPPESKAVAACDGASFLPEQFEFVGSELYLFLPNGMARTKLPTYLDRQIKIPTTVRNWNTVRALVELSAGV